jgi:phage FluMu gp28-like protein
LRAYGGDVGLDEFAFHADAETLWASASGRITCGFELAIWSFHFGRDTLFYKLTREAAKGKGGWSHYKVTLMDAIKAGLVAVISKDLTSRARIRHQTAILLLLAISCIGQRANSNIAPSGQRCVRKFKFNKEKRPS